MAKSFTDSDVYFEASQTLLEERNIEATIDILAEKGIERFRAKEAVQEAHDDLKKRVRSKALKGVAVGVVLLLLNLVILLVTGYYIPLLAGVSALLFILSLFQAIFRVGYGNDALSIPFFE